MNNLFNIYHPVGGAINHKCERGMYEYEQVATIEAESLLDAYRLAQNDFNDEYSELGYRSTCVGDIITESDDFGNVTHYIIDGIEFIQIPPTVLAYIDWGNHVSYMEHIAQQMLEYPEDYGLI
jgi:hypothetical protein